jgi:hypothetical protein
MGTGGRLIPPTGLVLMDYPWIWPQSTPTALLPWRFSGVHAAIPVRARKPFTRLDDGEGGAAVPSRGGGRERGGPRWEQLEDPPRSPPAAARQPFGPGQRKAEAIYSVVADGHRQFACCMRLADGPERGP